MTLRSTEALPSTEARAKTRENAAPPLPQSFRRRWLIVGMLFLFILINFGDKAVIGLAAGPIREELGLTATEFGLLASAFYFLFSAAALGVGFISNRVSSKWLLLILAAVWTVALVPMAGTVGFTALLLSRIVLGAGEGPAYPLSVHHAHSWFPNNRRSIPTALITIGSTVGVVAAGPGLTWIISTFNWHAAFVILGICSAIWGAVWIFVGKDGPLSSHTRLSQTRSSRTRSSHTRSARTNGPPAAGEMARATATTAVEHLKKVSYWRLFHSGTFLGLLFVCFCHYWSLAVLVAWVPSYLHTVMGFSTQDVGNIIVLPWLVGAGAIMLHAFISQWLMDRGISSRVARGILGGAAVVLSGCAIGTLAWGPQGIIAVVALIIGFEFGHIIQPVAMVVLAEIVPSSQRGAVQGTFLALLTLGGLVGPYVTGVMIDAAATPAEGYRNAWGLLAILLMVSGAVAMATIRPEKARLRLQKT